MINNIRIEKSNIFHKRRQKGLGYVAFGKIPAEGTQLQKLL